VINYLKLTQLINFETKFGFKTKAVGKFLEVNLSNDKINVLPVLLYVVNS